MLLDQDALRKPLAKLRKSLKGFPKQPPPELVHDVRTRTRRVRATVTALPWISASDEQRLLAFLRRIRRRAGPVRDIDLLTERALSVGPTGEREGMVQLLEHLGAKRHKAALELHSTVQKRAPKLRRQLRRCADLLDRERSGRRSAAEADATRSGVAARERELLQRLQSVPALDRDTLPPYRRQLKKLRCLLKTGAQADEQPFIAALSEVTDAIGQWHDWEMLFGIAHQVLDSKDHGKVLTALREAAEAAYGHAVIVTNRMRATYLDPRASRKGKDT